MTQSAPTPVVFVHGLWIHASAWAPWEERFRAAGYDPHAPGWPGEPDTVEAAKAGPELVAGRGIDEVVDHYGTFIASLPSKPVVIGHSFGGLMAQKLLGQNLAAAAVSIDAAPIKGVLNLPVSSLRVAAVALRNPANFNKSVALSPSEFRYGFANELFEEESARLFQQTIPSPAKPLFQAASANFLPHSAARVAVKNSGRGPLLLIAGGKDHTAPASTVRATAKLYRKSSAVTDYKEFPDRGHSLTIDRGWAEIADYALRWLSEKGFGPS